MTFEEARACVLSHVAAALPRIETELVSLDDAPGRVLAEIVYADRDYPPFSRSARDGFAVRAGDIPGELYIIGEVRAGESFGKEVQSGEAVEIMTGAPLPRGASAVVMIEHVTLKGDKVSTERALEHGENVIPSASEARHGEPVLKPGCRIDFAAIATLAMVGQARVKVYRRPQIAILATGDEIVELGQIPLEYQIRNTNTHSIAAQVRRAGGIPMPLPIARDLYGATKESVEHALRFDMVLLSGGVSAGKYDLVERVLSDLGAVFYFDRVLIQPGQPLVFGRVQEKFFFGLPGNPASTMLTFELFARAAVELLGGQITSVLTILRSRLTRDFRQKKGLTRFLPALLSGDGSDVTPIPWAGSGDIPALARANCFMVTEPDRERWCAGEAMRVLLK